MLLLNVQIRNCRTYTLSWYTCSDHFNSVLFGHSVVSNSLQPHGLQQTGLSVHHQLPEFTQTHVHWVSDAMQSSHPLSSPSPPTINLSQHQGLFKWVNSSHQVIKVLEFQLQHQSFQWIFSTLGWTGWISLQSKDSQESSPIPSFKSINSSTLSFLYSPILIFIHDYWKNNSFD